MNYKKGFQVKPLSIDDGVVTFTDGLIEVSPSEVSCIAYGYKWDSGSGTCILKNSTKVNVASKINEGYNKVLGRRNRLRGSVNNSVVAGEGNKLEGGNKNIFLNGNNNLVKSKVFNSSIVSGDNNTLSSGVNNSTIISGLGAISIRDNETVIGGFSNDGSSIHGSSPAFTTQVSQFVMQVILEDNTTLQPLSLNGIDYIPTHPNSRIYLDVTYMLIGDDSKLSVSGRKKEELWWVDNSGNASFVGSDVTGIVNITSPDISSVPTFVQANADGELSIVALGSVNEKQVAIASVNMVEVIFESDPTI
tara:strand:+ start:1846 stop:2760 length:915 start_codon:yes stop_codon:yes gene_type:complete